MKYKLVIFDLDGTLLDTLEDLFEAVNHALRKMGLPEKSLESCRQRVGHGVRNLVQTSLPEEMQADEALVDTSLAEFKAYYTEHIDIHTHPYPGMQELLGELHRSGVKLAVASNKFQEGTEYLVKKFFPGIPFVAIMGNREGYPLKPDPGIVEECLRSSGVSRSEAVMVGDSGTDMRTAANGGIPGIAVDWGYRSLRGTPGISIACTADELLESLCR